jgi:MFS family permease
MDPETGGASPGSPDSPGSPGAAGADDNLTTSLIGTTATTTPTRTDGAAAAAAAAAANHRKKMVIPWGRILCNGPVWALAVAKFGYYYSFFFSVTWMPTILEEMGMDKYVAAYCSAIPFFVTCPAIIGFGALTTHLVVQVKMDLGYVRKTLGTLSFAANIGCFVALMFIRKPHAAWALGLFTLMYTFNAAFIAGVAVNVLDIGAKYAGSIMALTHEFATGAGFLASVITGAMVKSRGRFEATFAVAAGINVVSMLVYLWFGSAEDQFGDGHGGAFQGKLLNRAYPKGHSLKEDMEYSTPGFERLCCCCCLDKKKGQQQEREEEHQEQGKGGKQAGKSGNSSGLLPYYMPQRWTIAFFAFAADFICYMDRANISATMIPMAELYGWTKTFQGLVFGVFFLGLMSAHLVGGYLADVYGAKKVLTFGVVWWSLFTILTPPSARFQWAVILVRFLMGAGEGINFPAVYALASEWYPEHEEHMLVTIAEMGVYLGIVVAMVCVPVIEQSIGWEPVFYIFGSFGFVWGGFFWVYGYDTPGRARAAGAIDEREYRFIIATRHKDDDEYE